MSDGEAWIIRELLAAAPAAAARVGPGDDAAVLEDGTVLTCDAMIEGVHWDGRHGPEDVGWKLAACNASDVAACGARPTWALLALAVPRPLDRGWVSAFARGLGAGLARFGLGLLGGDTTASPGPRVASLTAAGQLVGPALLRSGARAGQDLWVSGTLGDAGGAYALGERPPVGAHEIALRRAWARPEPPVALGPALAARGLAAAAMDLSDGLADDLARLCAASGVGARVWPEALPCSAALAACFADPLPHQVGFGEDYQLLFAAAPEDRGAVAGLGEELGISLSRIGEVTGGEVVLEGRDWPSGWQHFQG